MSPGGGWRDPGGGVRTAAAAAVLDRLPDHRQRRRGRGRGPGDLAALAGLPDTTRLGQGLPVSHGEPDLDRRAAVSPRPAGAIRRAVVPRAAADRPLPGPAALGRAGRLGIDGSPAARAAQPAGTGRSLYCARCSGSGSPKSPAPWAARTRRAASSRCGHAAIWTRADPGSRPTEPSATSSQGDSPAPSGTGTSTGCESCSFVIASASGSQPPGYAGGAARAIWIAGAQKVVPACPPRCAASKTTPSRWKAPAPRSPTGSPAPSTACSSSTRNPTPGRGTVLLLRQATGF